MKVFVKSIAAAIVLLSSHAAFADSPLSIDDISSADIHTLSSESMIFDSSLSRPLAAMTSAAALLTALEPVNGNLALLSQDGDNNTGTFLQSGIGNVGLIQQIGSNNFASIQQAGGHQHAMIVQNGIGNHAFISQR